LREKITTSTVPNTQLLDVAASDTDPELAARIANAVADRFSTYIVEDTVNRVAATRGQLEQVITTTESRVQELRQEIEVLEQGAIVADATTQARLSSLRASLDQAEGILPELQAQRLEIDLNLAAVQEQVKVLDPAEVPDSPYAPRVRLNTMIAAAAGLVLAAGAILLLHYLDNTVKVGTSFADVAGGPLLATVNQLPKLRTGSDQMFVLRQPTSTASEAIRLLRTNVEFAAAAREITHLAVTSPGPGEGKSTVTANLAVAMAQAGFTTAIVDADLRRPSQHRIFGVRNERGLTTLLTHRDQPWRWAASDVGVPNLTLVPSGPLPPNPADLLSLDYLSQLLAEIGSSVDIVLVDTPPVLAVSDPLVVATKVDGIVLVCRAGHTRMEALRRAAAACQQGAIRVVGVVLNQQAGRDADGYYSYAGYYGPDQGARPPADRNGSKPAHPTAEREQPVDQMRPAPR